MSSPMRSGARRMPNLAREGPLRFFGARPFASQAASEEMRDARINMKLQGLTTALMTEQH